MKVFVSSTVTDLGEYRSIVRDALQKLGHHPILSDPHITAGGPSRKQCFTALREADVFIGLYAYRYGEMPPGEATSLIEQEYHQARKLGKDIFVFQADPKVDWPEADREDDFIKRDRLERFLEDLNANETVRRFQSPADIIPQIRKDLARLSEIYDRLEKLQEWAATVDAKRKYDLVKELTHLYHQNRFPESDYLTAVRLIGDNFHSGGRPAPQAWIDRVEQLLKGEISPAQVAGQQKTIIPGNIANWVNAHRGIALAAGAVLVLLAGIIIGRRYVDEAGNVSGSSSGGTDAPKSVEWLLTTAGSGLESGTEDGLRRAIDALQTARLLRTGDDRLAGTAAELLDRIVVMTDDSTRRTWLKSVCDDLQYAPACKLLTEMDNRATRDSLSAAADDRQIRRVETLLRDARNRDLEPAARQAAYETVLDSFPVMIDPAAVGAELTALTAETAVVPESGEAAAPDAEAGEIADSGNPETSPSPGADTIAESPAASRTLIPDTAGLPQADSALNRQIAFVSGDTVTLRGALQSWRAFEQRVSQGSIAGRFARREIGRLQGMTNEMAHITADNNFVVAGNVDRGTRMPEDIDTVFPPGRVWMWSRINAPRAEEVTSRWYAGGRLYYTKSATISTPSSGYRIYFSYNHPRADDQTHEIRLYNAAGILIGRRVFRISDSAVARDSDDGDNQE